jgi:hypothetical protein
MAPPKKAGKGKGAKPLRKPKPGMRLIVRSAYDHEQPKLVRRPSYRKVFVDRGPQWLVLEPHRMAMAAGALFMTLALFAYALAGWLGNPVPAAQVLIGALATFVVGYAIVGIYTWYVLLVAEHEFGPPVEVEKKSLSLLGSAGGAAAAADQSAEAPAPVLQPAPAAPEPQPEDRE